MKIYEIDTDSTFKMLGVELESSQFHYDIEYTAAKELPLPPISMFSGELVLGDSPYGKKGAEFSSFISGGGWIVVGEKTKSIYEKLISGCGDWVVARYRDEVFYYFRVTKIIDALSDQTNFVYRDGYLVKIKDLVFRNDIDYCAAPVFRDCRKVASIFVSQDFYDLYLSNALTGLVFKERKIAEL